jgi:hypothetical protein
MAKKQQTHVLDTTVALEAFGRVYKNWYEEYQEVYAALLYLYIESPWVRAVRDGTAELAEDQRTTYQQYLDLRSRADELSIRIASHTHQAVKTNAAQVDTAIKQHQLVPLSSAMMAVSRLGQTLLSYVEYERKLEAELAVRALFAEFKGQYPGNSLEAPDVR